MKTLLFILAFVAISSAQSKVLQLQTFVYNCDKIGMHISVVLSHLIYFSVGQMQGSSHLAQKHVA